MRLHAGLQTAYSASGALSNDSDAAVTLASGGYINVPNDASLDITGNMTLEAWINPSSLTARQEILSKTNTSGTAGYEFYLDSSGKPTLVVGNGSATQTLGASYAVSGSGWHQVAVAVQGTSVQFYVDGAPDGSAGAITTARSDAGHRRKGVIPIY